jgi:phosphoribosylformimino-5-aminoimidazole carboxamide ribotide isomerase
MPASEGFQVIPVLDLLGGQVVHAVRGNRSAYKPIVSTLATGSDPILVARALLDRCALPAQERVLYVADLDAIQGHDPQVAGLTHLLEALPEVVLWLDAGFADVDAARSMFLSFGNLERRVRPVFGSESLQGAKTLAALGRDARAILSLDSKRAQAIDPSGCWRCPELWPPTVIVMTLDRVGAAGGPDLAMFAHLHAKAPHRRWIGAGGVRCAADLAAARAAGASAWLVASALHDGRLDPRQKA